MPRKNNGRKGNSHRTNVGTKQSVSSAPTTDRSAITESDPIVGDKEIIQLQDRIDDLSFKNESLNDDVKALKDHAEWMANKMEIKNTELKKCKADVRTQARTIKKLEMELQDALLKQERWEELLTRERSMAQNEKMCLQDRILALECRNDNNNSSSHWNSEKDIDSVHEVSQIESESVSITCGICDMEEVVERDMLGNAFSLRFSCGLVKLKCNCEHYVHSQCFKSQLSNALGDMNNSSNKIPMLCVGCQKEDKRTTILAIHLYEMSDPLELSDADLLKYTDRQDRESAVIVQCPFEDCKFDDNRIDPDGINLQAPNVSCSQCHKMFCARCNCKWSFHLRRDGSDEFLTCEEYQALPEEQKDPEEELNRRAAESFARQNGGVICPGCGVPIVKSEGCNHMTCAICKCHICYTCNAALDSSDPYSHFFPNDPNSTCWVFDQ